MIGLTDFAASVEQAGSVIALQANLGLAMWGAHHRILTDYAQPGNRCAWSVADYRRDSRNDADSFIAELGACTDAGPFRIGAGIGYDRSDSTLALGGNRKTVGWHGVGEVDLRLGATGAVASITVIHGKWQIDTNRRYLNGASADTSRSSTDAHGWAMRARVDWVDMLGSASFSLTPSLSYTHSRIVVDGYQETGGAFPVRVARFADTGSEGRAVLTGRFALAETTALRLRGEYLYRFDRYDGGTSYQIIATGIGGLAGLTMVDRDNARIGADLDQRIGKAGLVSVAVTKAVANQFSNPVSFSATLRLGF